MKKFLDVAAIVTVSLIILLIVVAYIGAAIEHPGLFLLVIGAIIIMASIARVLNILSKKYNK